MEPDGAFVGILHDVHAGVVVALQPVQEGSMVLCCQAGGRDVPRLPDVCNEYYSIRCITAWSSDWW